MNIRGVYITALHHLEFLGLTEVVLYDSEDEIRKRAAGPDKLKIPGFFEVLYPPSHFAYSPDNLFGTLSQL